MYKLAWIVLAVRATLGLVGVVRTTLGLDYSQSGYVSDGLPMVWSFTAPRTSRVVCGLAGLLWPVSLGLQSWSDVRCLLELSLIIQQK